MNKTIALFPGAFRPPHKAHYAAVKELSERKEVSHTVVIISGRHRKIPNTLESLGPECAEKIWTIFCKSLNNVSVEVASSSAVDHAIDFLNNIAPTDQLLFCLGQADFDNNDDRFLKLTNGGLLSNSNYSITMAKTGQFSVRATQLRGLLSQGEKGKQEFFNALPDHLTIGQRHLIWKICLQSKEDHTGVIAKRIVSLIEKQRLGKVEKIQPINSKSNNPVFHVLLEKDKNWIVKEAKDTEKNANTTANKGIKPRTRLSVERRSIRLLNRIKHRQFELPEVVYFNKSQKILIQTRLFPNGQTLDSMLKIGQIDTNVILKLSQILASCHNIPNSKPLRASEDADSQHWQSVLYSKTKGLINPNLSSELLNPIEEIYSLSLGNTSKQFVFLNFQPKHVCLESERIGIVDLESSSSIGDPAFDLGIFIGRYLALSAVSNNQQNSILSMQSLLKGYFDDCDLKSKSSFYLRVAKFIGIGLLLSSIDSRKASEAKHKLMQDSKKFLNSRVKSYEQLHQFLS